MSDKRDFRPGEELDVNRLHEYLCGHVHTDASDITIEQFPAGSSNLTYLVRTGGREYVLRRPPFGNTVATAHDMRREFDVLSKLAPVYDKAPQPLFFCDDTEVIGAEFYLMEKLDGTIIRGKAPDELARSETTIQATARAFIDALAELHSIDISDSGLSEFDRGGGYTARQVNGWVQRYSNSRTDDHPELESAGRWLVDNIPPDSGTAMIHNDYKFDNVILDPLDLTRVIGVLDWEMATVGDPLMDLGTTLGYWMSAEAGDEMMSMPFNPRVVMQNISRSDLVAMYSEAVGGETGDMTYYYVFGTFKVAVIAQQIYARYVNGSTSDSRFAAFGKFVNALGKIAANAVATGKI